MFGLLMTIIVGFIVGVIAKLIMPGKENMGFIITTLLGIAGSMVATYVGQAAGWYRLATAPAGSVPLSAHLSFCGSIRSSSRAARRPRLLRRSSPNLRHYAAIRLKLSSAISPGSASPFH